MCIRDRSLSEKEAIRSVQVFGRPLELVQPAALQYKVQEPILLLGKDHFDDVDVDIRVKGGGHTSQIYANRYVYQSRLQL